MAKRKPSRSKNAPIHITMQIEEHLTHYAFGERFPRDQMGPALTETLILRVWGTVVEPKEKAGRDLQVTISGHEWLAHPMPSASANAVAPIIGSLQWAADRVASLYVPPSTIWPLANAIAVGEIKQLGMKVDGPLKGSVPICGMHALTRDLEIRTGRRKKSEADAAEAEQG